MDNVTGDGSAELVDDGDEATLNAKGDPSSIACKIWSMRRKINTAVPWIDRLQRLMYIAPRFFHSFVVVPDRVQVTLASKSGREDERMSSKIYSALGRHIGRFARSPSPHGRAVVVPLEHSYSGRLPSQNTRPVARMFSIAFLAMAFASTNLSGASAQAQAIDPAADRLLKKMSDYLGAQKTIRFTFDSDIEVITPQLEKIQFGSSGTASLQRPDKLRARRTGGYSDVELVFDGKAVGIADIAGNGYAKFEVPGDVDNLISALRQGHGVALPAADLLLTKSYDVLIADVVEGKYIGQSVIGGRSCEHLAFRNAEVDWQLWIEAGERPAPCMVVITSKTLAAAPQYSVRVTSWEAGIPFSADLFVFAPPQGAKQLGPNALLHLDELPPPASKGEKK